MNEKKVKNQTIAVELTVRQAVALFHAGENAIDEHWCQEAQNLDGKPEFNSTSFYSLVDGVNALLDAVEDKVRNRAAEDEEPVKSSEAEFDRGYNALAKSLNDWVTWWNAYTSGNRANLTDEEEARVASVADFGGKFEDFVTREIFFIEEAS
jgi:hypothetical protein